MTVFWSVCEQISITKANLNCAIQMVRRCFPVTHLSNHAAKSPYECPDLQIVIWGEELRDLLYNHFRQETVHFQIEILPQMEYQSVCQKNTETNHASSPRSGMLNRKLGKIFSLMCTLGNSNIAITIHHCNFKSALV